MRVREPTLIIFGPTLIPTLKSLGATWQHLAAHKAKSREVKDLRGFLGGAWHHFAVIW